MGSDAPRNFAVVAAHSEVDVTAPTPRRAIIVDACILIKEATRLARVPGQTFLVVLGRMQPGILFTTKSALDEAHEHMHRLGDRTGVTDRALELLDTVLTPLLTVVTDAPTSGAEHEATLAERDADDLPTLRLALWLRGWLLSDDLDLDDVGAIKDYVPLLRGISQVVAFEFGVELSATVIWAVLKWLATTTGGRALLLLLCGRIVISVRTPQVRARWSPILKVVVDALCIWSEAQLSLERQRVAAT